MVRLERGEITDKEAEQYINELLQTITVKNEVIKNLKEIINQCI